MRMAAPGEVKDAPGLHLLYNEAERKRYNELSTKFITMHDLTPEDFDLNEEFCALGDRNPRIQDAVYHQWCPAECQRSLAKYRTARDKIRPYWGRLGSQHQGIIDEMCSAAVPLIEGDCASKHGFPDVSKEVYWQTLCANPEATRVELAWLDAQNGLEDLRNVGANSSAQNHWVETRMCPLVERLERHCTPERIAERYANDAYFQLCKRGADCPTVPDRWYEKQEPVRTMQDPGMNMLDTIEQYCKVAPDMERCGHDFYSRDPLYQEWCTDAPCNRAWLGYTDAHDDFLRQQSQGINEDGKFQIMEQSVCPAAQAVIDGCGSDSETASYRRDLVKRNPYYQEYCANPECTKATRRYERAQKDFDWSVEQGMDRDGQLQQMQQDLCPAMQAVMEEPTCTDKSRVESSPYWEKYCRNPDCLANQLEVERAEQDFYGRMERGVDANELWQQSAQSLCPAYTRAIETCGEDSELVQRILKNPYYHQYCENPECAAAENRRDEARKAYYWGRSQGVDEQGQYSDLIQNVCPAFNEVHEKCPAPRSTDMDADPSWRDYCSLGVPCLTQKRAAIAKIADMDWQASQGMTPDGIAQQVTSNLCPIFKDMLETCTDPRAQDWVRGNRYWKEYCQFVPCASAVQTVRNEILDYDWSVTQRVNKDGLLSKLIRDVCPAFNTVFASTPCQDGVLDSLSNEPTWRDYCSRGATCLENERAIMRVESDLDWQMSQGLNAIGKDYILQNKVCPAYTAAEVECPATADMMKAKSRWYDPYCKNIE
jgi:hypothetical protein